MRLKSFLRRVDHDRIVAAIRAAEQRSRGEVRVHASNRATSDPRHAAAQQFEALGMAATAERLGVLIYVAPLSRNFAVLGDSGIHASCPAGFWEELAAAMEQDFRAGHFTDGIVRGVESVGEMLAAHFPRLEGAPDHNELPDAVSED